MWKLRGARRLCQGLGTLEKTGLRSTVSLRTFRHIWDTLLAEGKDEAIVPAGLGARDSLRFEVALPLYGHELSPEITPLEAGLGFFVKLKKADFIGREALVSQKEKGLSRKIVGLELMGRGVPREGYPVMSDGKQIGHLTSGAFSPTMKQRACISSSGF